MYDSSSDTVTESVYELDSNGDFNVTEDVYKSYWDNGYILIRSILNKEETDLVERGWTSDPYLKEKIYFQSDVDNDAVMRLIQWDDASNDATGLFARSQKLAGTVEKLLGDEIYHYHAKFLEKPPNTGGSFIWHQDYGYWYHFGLLSPEDMCTVFLALDDMDTENGCLKILPGSHKYGRMDHIRCDEQMQADLVRVQLLIDRIGLKHVVLKRGDVLIFHSNILHRSDRNNSSRRRLALATAYNTKRNNPFKVHHHPCYKPMGKVDNGALLRWGDDQVWDPNKGFCCPDNRRTHLDTISGGN